jgi:glyoxylase-like metal-dependent hydrolase (beta-lactamase superfamily II)
MHSVGRFALLVLLAGCVAVPARAPLPGTPIAQDVALLPGTFVPGQQPDGNSVLLRGTHGLVVVDSGRHARHTQQIIDAARASGLPVVAIVNTHWHLDHVAGNAALRAAFPRAEVIASDAIGAALHGFLADYRAQLQGLVAQPGTATPETVAAWREEIGRIDAGARLAPTRIVTDAQAMALAGRRVRIGLERNAVSGGDVWLVDAATRTLVAGDLVTLPVPLFDTACSAGWQAALQRLQAQEFALLVPGHGAPLDRAQFATYRAAFDRLLACAASDAPAATCKVGWRRDAGALVPARDAALADSLLDYYIPHVLRAPPERRSRYCRKEPSK